MIKLRRIPIPASALVTVIILMGIFLSFLGTLVSFSGSLQTQVTRETKTRQAISLGNSGLNYAMAEYRRNPNYQGKGYGFDTGEVDTFIDKRGSYSIISAQSYVPNRAAANRICLTHRVSVDTSLRVIDQTYQEVNTCPRTPTGPNSAPTLTIHQPDGVDDDIANGNPYSVIYSLADPDDDPVTAVFSLVANLGDTVGTPLKGACSSASKGDHASCSWTADATPGTYYLYATTDDGINPPVEAWSGQLTISDRLPTLIIRQPDGVNDSVTQGKPYQVLYNLNDPDPGQDVTAKFFYDTNTNPDDGKTAIVTCADALEYDGMQAVCTFYTGGIPLGNYYIYGEVNGSSPLIWTYSPGTLTIKGDAEPRLLITEPNGINDTIVQNASYTVTYSLIDEEDAVTAKFSYVPEAEKTNPAARVAITGCEALPETAAGTCTWQTTGVSPGKYFVIGEAKDTPNPIVTVTSSGPITISEPDNIAPTLQLLNPKSDPILDVIAHQKNAIGGGSYTVFYVLVDPDNVVTGELYYDTDTNKANGTGKRITSGSCYRMAEDPQETDLPYTACTFNRGELPAGTYYLYASVTDRPGRTIDTYSPGTLTIYDTTLTLHTPDTTVTAQNGTGYTINYTLDWPFRTVTGSINFINRTTQATTSACTNVPEGTTINCTGTFSGLAPGDYDVSAFASDGSANMNARAPGFFRIVATPPTNTPPSLSIVGLPDPLTTNNSIVISPGGKPLVQVKYTLTDPDNTVTSRFFVDTDNKDFNGTPLSNGCSAAGEGTSLTCTNSQSDTIPPGTYFVYGSVADGTNPEVSVYSTMQFKVVEQLPTYQCSDTVDNDADGQIDFPADVGCTSPSDTSENNDYHDDVVSSTVSDAAGNVYVAGWAEKIRGDKDLIILKYKPNGQLDTLWGNTYSNSATMTTKPGMILYGNGRFDAKANDIAIDSSNNIYVVGQTKQNGSGCQWLIAKYDSAGKPAANWGPDGVKLFTPPNSICAEARGVALDTSAQYLYVVGSWGQYISQFGDTFGGPTSGIKVFTTATGGTPTTWGDNGAKTFLNQTDLHKIVVDSNSVVYAVGEAGFRTPAGGGKAAREWILTNYNNTTKHLGFVTFDHDTNQNWSEPGSDLTIDSSNNIYVVGTISNTSGQYDWAVRKYKPGTFGVTNTLDTAWGTNGMRTYGGALDGWYGMSLALDSLNQTFLVGWDKSLSESSPYVSPAAKWSIGKWSATGGTGSWSGVPNTNIIKQTGGVPVAITISGNSLYVAGTQYGISGGTQHDWLIRKYDKNTGLQDSSFGTGGNVVFDSINP